MAEEARALLGEIETVVVKDGVSRTAAQCLHPQVAQEHIRQAAERMRAQWSDTRKRRWADVEIRNDGTPAALRSKARHLYRLMLESH